PPDEREFLMTELAECRAAIETDDLALVEDAVARLEVAAQRIGEAIYAAADVGGGDGGGGEVDGGGEGEARWRAANAITTSCSASRARHRNPTSNARFASSRASIIPTSIRPMAARRFARSTKRMRCCPIPKHVLATIAGATATTAAVSRR